MRITTWARETREIARDARNWNVVAFLYGLVKGNEVGRDDVAMGDNSWNLILT